MSTHTRLTSCHELRTRICKLHRQRVRILDFAEAGVLMIQSWVVQDIEKHYARRTSSDATLNRLSGLAPK
jgi:hypothetical protein